MDDKRALDELREELDKLRGRLDELRVRANLGKMEARDRLQELGDLIEPAGRKAADRLTGLANAGAEEARTLARSLQAGWDALRRTHRDLTQEAERERKAEEEERRS